MKQPAQPSRWLHRYAVLTAGATFLLVIAGGLVTSTGSGLAVPDWPLSYGTLFPPMVGGIFYEHGHRMIAGAVGLMTVALALWLWRQERRTWLRRLGMVAVAAVLAQALLGGLTVLLLLPAPISVGHAGLAMAFFVLISALAWMTAPAWRQPHRRAHLPGLLPLPRLAAAAAVATYLQILLGATVRHTGAGLACGDFPLCHGQILPPVTTFGLGLHLAHRAGALVVAALVVATAVRIWRRHRAAPELQALAAIALVLVAAQIILGGFTVWRRLAVVPTTAHVACGALLLVTLALGCVQSYRRYRCGSVARVPLRQEVAA